jgi:chromosome segregation ATPase
LIKTPSSGTIVEVITEDMKRKDLPVTLEMLHLVRDDLRAEIRSFQFGTEGRFKSIDARFEKIDRRFDQIDARFEQIDARFEQIDARFEQIDRRFERLEAKWEAKFDEFRTEIKSDIEKIKSIAYQTHALIEEQNVRNGVVMDGLTFLFDRQDRSEARLNAIEKNLMNLGIIKPN